MLSSPATLVLGGRRFDASRPAVMGIINRNSDSFYTAARYADTTAAVERAKQMIDEGVDIIDIGGVRAGQEGEWVTGTEEIQRVLPVLEALRELPVLTSVDTWRTEVAQACAGLVDLINDTWAGADADLVHVAAETGAGYVISHTGGLPPRTDPTSIDYGPGDAVVEHVLDGLQEGARRAEEAGLPRERILIDPTLDFGKTTLNSLALVANTHRIVALGYPVLQAISRKDFVGETLDLPADERLEGTLAATAISAWQGATVFRAHDVRATRRVLDMVASIRGDRAPVRADRGR
ncbi:dihydropteroate synthase [Tessaracoccus sp. MC1865]|uniref:dihydropteroate synthase n=1 Tax=Tessaracoccus sp. MC1865 TaxID=2760310 RepID=UPI0016013F74|nr:dihydropteroate synthase [Tessaracoccus sp. MC1865]MBB1484219.1 dihydropteroate synthase [Tessaracoccus sp. MC1865]QTO37238.1 dihydropteroate synthase [Tessaracoccus sp. MC1865]